MSKDNSRRRRVPLQNSNSDRISDLPGNVIENIIMRLPIRDAVRTSILSKKWRNKWSDAPQLVFDGSFRGLRWITIYELLLLHSGPIHKFSLSIPVLRSCPQIDRLILFLSRKGIQDFELCISFGDRHKLPSYFFSCLQLKHLNLQSCELIPPLTFKGFSKLVSLKLRRVDFPPNFKNFISNFPLLEELFLDECTDVSCLEINCPNLKLIYYCGSYKSLHFKNVPRLAFVSVYDIGDPHTKAKMNGLVEVLRGLPALEYLSVDDNFLKSLAGRDVSKRVQTPLKHLTTIRLFYICFAEVEEIYSVVDLLRSSPNVRRLQIEMYPEAVDDATTLLKSFEVLEAQDRSEFALNQLKEVKLQRFHGTKPEIELMKFILATSPALETMRLQPDEDMSGEEQVDILKEIIRFRRASPAAEIICENFVHDHEDVVTHRATSMT